MSKASLWDASSVGYDELPSLQDLFKSCDHALLMRVILEDFAQRGASFDKKQHKAMCHRLEASLCAMQKVPLAPIQSGKWILVPRETYGFSAHERAISWRIHAAQAPLLSRRVAKEFVAVLNDRATTYQQVKKSSKKLVKQAKKADSREIEQVMFNCWERNYTLDPWEETLGCKVWLGGAWCSRERYAVLASAYWEMTFYGFEHSKVQARIMQERAKKIGAAIGERGTANKPRFQAKLGKVENRFGLEAPDRFMEESRDCFAKRIAILNHHAQGAYFKQLLSIAQRLERGSV